MNPEPPESPPRIADILIVDDTPANLQVLAGMLKDRGHKVRPVPSGKLALLAAQRDPPDLILLDINMPEMNGYQVCEQLKRDEWLRGIPVIFISALAEPLDKVRAFAIGGVDYITKPFQMEELHARVDTHVKLRRMQLALEDARAGLERASERMSRDLEAAEKIQKMFLPSATPKVAGMEVAWGCRPCSELGGYGLNMIPLGEGRVGFYVLDVGGRGVAAALLSVTLSRMLSAGTEVSSILFQGRDALGQPDVTAPATVADELNRMLRLDKSREQLATLVYGIVDLSTRIFRYVTAGHPAPLHLPANAPAVICDTPGSPIGLGEEAYLGSRINLAAGDRVYLYSDGLTGARNSKGERFGGERLVNVIGRQRGAELGEGITSLLAEVAGFQGGEKSVDDLSIVGFEVGEVGAEANGKAAM